VTTISPHRAGDRNKRRDVVFERLREADGVTYDSLCNEVATAFPERTRFAGPVRAVREVRALLFQGYATTESDESVWLTPQGWKRVEAGL
jgi:hypothetical protein